MSDGRIASTLEDVRRRLRRARIGEAALRSAAGLGALAMGLAALDNLAHLPAALRLSGSAAFVACVGALAWSRLWPALAAAPTDDEVALAIERALPGLENRVINAVQLGRADLDRFGAAAAAVVAGEATAALAGIEPRAVVNRLPLRRAGLLAGAALAGLALYAVAFPEHLRNALERYARPGASVPPLTRTRLAIEPGDVTVTEGDAVAVHAVATGAIPARASLVVRGASGEASYDMPFAGDGFAFELTGLRAPLTYLVRAGDAESAAFCIEVVEPPRLVAMAVEYRYPDYLGRKPECVEPSDGNLAAVEGTRARLVATANRPVRSVEARLESGRPALAIARGDRVTLDVDIIANDRYRLLLRDARGLSDRDPPLFSIACLPDAPPAVAIREPEKDVSARASAVLTVAVEARDDVGLSEVSLEVAPEGSRPARRLETWPGDGRREARRAANLSLAALGAAPGETLALVARARDLKGQESASPPLLVRVVSERDGRAALVKDLAAILARVRKVLEKQRAAHELARKGGRAGPAQEEILALTRGLLADWTDPELRRTRARALVAGLAEREMPAAVRETGPPLLVTQQAIVRGLEQALGDLERLAAAVRAGDLDRALQAAEPLAPAQAAKDLLRGLKELLDEQPKVIAATEALRGIAPEDLTDEQKKALDALRATEEKWGKFLAEKSTELSKVPPQDFSNGDVAKELVEARGNVVKAADALSKKATEIAVPLEEAGLELAKALTTDIERWLADAPDRVKWVMEEPKSQPDMPMADLPAELEDLVGDLLDKEEDMTKDTEDVTSSWMDSMDKGAGWGVSDGPISDMSAKGITGNLNPNSNEIAGRSGEGRSGKSSGQMVEESASGKGGRQTPTRLTADPYEKGRVKDTSKDATGGSTGGGKESGANREGLRGEPPPETARKMDRLASEQAEIRSAAEKVKVALERRAYRSEDLERAIEAMRKMEDDLRRRRGGDYASLAKSIVERLDAAKKVTGDAVASRDGSQALPKEARAEIRNALAEPLPRGYEDAIRAYFRSLSEGAR